MSPEKKTFSNSPAKTIRTKTHKKLDSDLNLVKHLDSNNKKDVLVIELEDGL
jgi:hypothetical protein